MLYTVHVCIGLVSFLMDPGIHRYFRWILDSDEFFFVSVKIEIQEKEYKVSITMEYIPNVLFSVFIIIGIHQRNPSTKISMDLSIGKLSSVLALLETSRISPAVGVVISSAGWEQRQPASF